MNQVSLRLLYDTIPVDRHDIMTAPSTQINDAPLVLEPLTNEQHANLAAIWAIIDSTEDFDIQALFDKVDELCIELFHIATRLPSAFSKCHRPPGRQGIR
jgi:hypothetical protein